MTSIELRIGVSGAAGRMGKALVQAVDAESQMCLGMALERSGNPFLGVDAGAAAGLQELGVKISESYASEAFDTLIEFTSPAATVEHVSLCRRDGKSIVIGTTGFNDEQKEAILAAADDIRIVLAPNMSVGVNVCLKLLQTAAAAFGDAVDVEVIEAHHRHKVDAPSGTALKMGEVVADALGQNLKEHGIFERSGIIGPRPEKSIGFSTVRGGDIVGDHSVYFIGEGERLEITHRSSSRVNYASGAVRAARWLTAKAPGLYDMWDVLGLR